MKHRSTFKQKNKKHKSGHQPKNQFKDPKVNAPGASIQNEKGQKDRRNQAASARRDNKMEAAKLAKLIGSKNGPPKVVGILPCSANADAPGFLNIFNFQPEVEGFMIPSGTLVGGQFQCRITPFAIPRTIDVLIDVGKIADIIILLFLKDEPLDDWGAMAISLLKSIGMPQAIAVVASPSGEPVPRDSLVNYRNYIQKDLPDVERILPLATNDDLAQFVRFLSVTTPKSISWKENRPNMLIQNFIVNPGNNTVEIFGYLKGARLNVHQVVTIPYLGDFYIAEANGAIPSEDLRHPLIYEQGENDDIMNADIHAPQTVESYESIDQIKNDFDKVNLEDNYGYNDGDEQNLDEDDREAQLAEEQAEVWRRNQEDLEFPDEFDYNGNTILRERLRRYRGLKSFNSSPWNQYESLPPQYARIFEFSNFARTSEAAVAEQDKGEIEPGTRTKITLLIGDNDINDWGRIPDGRALTMFGLFRNETRLTVLNATFFNNGDPIRSKEQILIICGFRHLWIQPLFNEDTRASKHLYLRVVDHNQPAIASFIAPAMMQGAPVSYFKEIDGSMYFIGTGSIKTVDPNRMVIKRIILTGNPYRTIGRNARVTMMFFNKEDILYFRTVGLWTKNKRKGHIMEPIGLKGHFKACFNEIAQPEDTVCMSLYKRVFPKMTTFPVAFLKDE
ncbi:pre-rRNA-processing protein [Tritrichomonas foetus]|uniref:Pre-rRNA-processing protein n=1 Tax=Tritrichomonas foetus TaxID=1144522 RepID=A0A1J4KNL1_9EUKA|nr:pre-rRNA-processing protein [Tritrichomonas foetus]|eukprot:OHT11286.1 pre-rRNA-processing protein [Tritrichomonas foetus]